jgi:hypothetical protein
LLKALPCFQSEAPPPPPALVISQIREYAGFLRQLEAQRQTADGQLRQQVCRST